MKIIIIILMSVAVGTGIGASVVAKILFVPMNRNSLNESKFHMYYLLMNKWLKMKQDGKNLAEYFEKKNYKLVAIYGMANMGERLVNELKKSKIDIRYGIDQNAEIYNSETFLVLKPDDELPIVDVVIVTSVFYFEEIEYELRNKVKCPIVSLEEVLEL